MKKQRSLVQKLASIMRVVDRIEKRGHNDLDEYDYPTEGDIKDAFRSRLARANIFLAPKVQIMPPRLVTLPLRSGNVDTWVTDVIVEWTFHDGDSRETLVCVSASSGEDKADKGVAKAITGSLKSLLMSSFLLRSGDDPDANSKTAGKEVREKKVEAAQAIGKAKIEGTLIPTESLPLWYSWPPEAKGLEAAVRGTDAALEKYRDELMYHGKYSPRHKCYIIPAAKVDDLKFVLEQLHVELTEVGSNANS